MPRDSFRAASNINYIIARVTVAFVWVYHGLVPKLLGPHPDELAMNLAAGFTELEAIRVAHFAGAAEMLFGVAVLVFWNCRWPLVLSAASMIILLLFVIAAKPVLITGAFNPVTTNISIFVLSFVAYRLHAKDSHGS